MNLAQSRRVRNYKPPPLLSSGKTAVELLLRELNARGSNADVVREMVTDMNEVDRIVGKKGYPRIKREKVGSTIDALASNNIKAQLDKRGYDTSVVKLMIKIRARYESFKPRLRPVFPLKNGWHFSWMNPWSGDPQSNFLLWTYLLIIHDLGQEGRLRRVRKCAVCGRWFFAYGDLLKFRFCLDGCREKHWRSTPEGKMKRAAYKRKYRKNENRRNREALREAKAMK